MCDKSVKSVVSQIKIRERVSGSTFWRHSWHSSSYLNKDLSSGSSAPLSGPVGSLENMTRFNHRKYDSLSIKFSPIIMKLYEK